MLLDYFSGSIANVISKAVCNFVIACLDYLTSELSHHTWSILNRYVPLFQACCSIFSRNFLKDLLSHASAMFVILIFNICNVYEMISHIHRMRSGKDGRYGFKISRKHQRLVFVFSLLVRLIWFCDTAKLSKSVLSNFKNHMHRHQP